MERGLLGFGEIIVRVAVENHLADAPDRNLLLRNDLGRIEDVEAECHFVLFLDDLQAKLPFEEVAALDRLEHVPPVEVGVHAGDFLRLVPPQREEALGWLPVELDEARHALGVDEPEGVNAESFHRGEAARQGAVAHDPHQHVRRFRGQRREVPERVVSGGGLRDFVVRLGLYRMDEVGKLDRVLDEEDRHVVADEVPVALVGIEFDREAAHVARRVGRAARSGDRRKADEDGRLFRRVVEQLRHGEVGQVLVDLEEAVRRRAARMHHPLGNALMVEMGDLFAQMEIFEQSRAALARFQRVLVVRDRQALIGGQDLPGLDRVEAQSLGLGRLRAAGLLVGCAGLAGGARFRRGGRRCFWRCV